MNRIVGLVFIAALVCAGSAYADGRVLSVVSPSPEELKEPAVAVKPSKPAQKATAKKMAGKVPQKTAKKAGKKVAAPKSGAEAEIQPLESGQSGGATVETERAATKEAATIAEGKESGVSASLVAPEPHMVNLGKQYTAEKTAKAEKTVEPAYVYVLIQSRPANAEVVVDGYYAGSTPLELPIKEGIHSLRMIYPGYEEWERKFNAFKGMRISAILVEKAQTPAAP